MRSCSRSYTNPAASPEFLPTRPIPERNVGLGSLRLECLDDLRRAVAAVGSRFTNRDLVPILDALELLQIRLVVVSCSRRDLGIQDDPTVGVDRLMHFIFELPRRSLLLGQGGVGVGATAVRLVGQLALCSRDRSFPVDAAALRLPASLVQGRCEPAN